MKKLVALLTLGFALTAHAQFTVCPVIEFAELQTYSDAELEKMQGELVKKAIAVEYGRWNREAEVKNCFDQEKRVTRIMEARLRDAKTKPQS